MSQPYNPYAQQPVPAAPQQVPGGFVPQAPQQYAPAPAAPPVYPQGYPQPGQNVQYYSPQQYAGMVAGHPQGAPAYGQAPAPAVPPLAQGSLDAFYQQPSVGGGAALKFNQLGDSHAFVFARDVRDSDVVQQTQMGTNIPATFGDGSPMYQLVCPVITPDGNNATWYVKGATREVLLEAMAKAGAPANTFPKKGDAARVTFVAERPTRYGNKAKVYSVDYTLATQAGGGMNTAQQFAPQAPAHPAGGPSGTTLAQAPQQYAQQPAAPVQPQGYPQQGFVQQPEQAQPTPGVAAPAAQGYVPQGMDPNSPQFAAFQQLLGQAAGQPQQ
jgi:hypothetical protein